MKQFKDRKLLIELFSSGLSKKEVADRVGCCQTTLNKWVKKLNINAAKAAYCDKDFLFHEFITLNKSAIQIATENKASPITINKYLKKFEIYKGEEQRRAARKKMTEKTCMEKYGVRNVMQQEEVKQRAKKTSREKWGVTHYSKTSEWKDSVLKTNLEKRGVKWVTQDKDVKERIKQTCLNRHGVENPSFSSEISEKKRQTLLRNHGYSPFDSYNAGSVRSIDGYTGKQIAEKYKIPYSSLGCLMRNVKFNTSLELFDYLEGKGRSISKLELLFSKELDIPIFNKKVLFPDRFYRPDFKLSDSLYVNVDGIYWHSTVVNSDKKYHFNMRKAYEDSGKRIFQFREDELTYKMKIVRSIVLNSMGKSKIYYARKTIVKRVSNSDAKIFLEENHLMGSIRARHLGLYIDQELLSIISYREFKDRVKIDRFCNKVGVTVVGGQSRLLKHACGKSNKEIHYWVDLRYGTGNHLKLQGFEHCRDTLGWKWTDFKRTYNRLRCRANMDSRRLSQGKYAKELGLVKIYDAGQRLWVRSSKSV